MGETQRMGLEGISDGDLVILVDKKGHAPVSVRTGIYIEGSSYERRESISIATPNDERRESKSFLLYGSFHLKDGKIVMKYSTRYFRKRDTLEVRRVMSKEELVAFLRDNSPSTTEDSR